jgi:hypothetical protein
MSKWMICLIVLLSFLLPHLAAQSQEQEIDVCSATVVIGGNSYTAPQYTGDTLTSTETIYTGDTLTIVTIRFDLPNERVWFETDGGRWVEAWTGFNTNLIPVVIDDPLCYMALPYEVIR